MVLALGFLVWCVIRSGQRARQSLMARVLTGICTPRQQVLAIDSARDMVDEFNKIAAKTATKRAYPNCELKAVWGDLINHEKPQDPKIANAQLSWDLDGVFESFDMVVLCV